MPWAKVPDVRADCLLVARKSHQLSRPSSALDEDPRPRHAGLAPFAAWKRSVCAWHNPAYCAHSLHNLAVSTLGCSATTIAMGETLCFVAGFVAQLERGDPLLRSAVPGATGLP
jgi:hypothetical protein